MDELTSSKMNLFLLIISCSAATSTRIKPLRPTDLFVNAVPVDLSHRRINGTMAAVGQFPWQVRILYTTKQGNLLCGGSLIRNKWVLTAAQCAYGAWNFKLFFGGITMNTVEEGRVRIDSEEMYIHPEYNHSSLSNDVALIKLPKPVTYNHRIQRIALSNEENVGAGERVVASGWGSMSDTVNQLSNDLLYTRLKTISNEECQKKYRSGLIRNTILCAIGLPHNSPCNGDSGGPLVLGFNSVPYLAGVVSFVPESGCAKGYPSGYARVASFLPWIAQVITRHD